MSQKPSAILINTIDKGAITHVFLNNKEISHMISDLTVRFEVNSLPSVTMTVNPESLTLILDTAHIDVKSDAK